MFYLTSFVRSFIRINIEKGKSRKLNSSFNTWCHITELPNTYHRVLGKHANFRQAFIFTTFILRIWFTMLQNKNRIRKN